MVLETVDPPYHRGMIDSKLFCGSGHRSAAHDGEHEAEVVPVDRAALIQHFRTSMVQYLGLVSYKMQVKRIVKRSRQDQLRDREVIHALNRTLYRRQGSQGHLGPNRGS